MYSFRVFDTPTYGMSCRKPLLKVFIHPVFIGFVFQKDLFNSINVSSVEFGLKTVLAIIGVYKQHERSDRT